ncbi:MAG TPA: hypothetical protein VM884_05585 [Flavisolibacter sp.]|jgi:hypothetical protein|nr:hypothetical protein [Flavisolibacter sp.]
MKRNLAVILVVAVVLCSCGSTSSFESPNSLRNMPGTIHLRNGKSYKGRLVIQSLNAFSRPVKIFTDGDERPMQFNLGDVAAYQIKNDRYELKEIKGGLRLGKDLAFMKRLTPDASRIHLYEHLKKVTESTKGYTAIGSRYETEYYLQLPDEEGQAVYPLDGSKFVPKFDEKMSTLLKQCPDLAKKIAAKENGYFYAQVSFSKEKRASVLMTIIEEYNRCK